MPNLAIDQHTAKNSSTFVFDRLLKFAPNILFRDDAGASISYLEIANYAQRKSFKATKNKLTFCLSKNDLGGVAGYVSLLAAETVPMMLGASLSTEAKQTLARAYQPEFIWLEESDAVYWPQAEIIDSLHGYYLLALPEVASKGLLHKDLGLLLSTSGSTGSSKYVRLSRGNIWTNAYSIATYLELTKDELPITTLPLNYSYGISVLHSHIYVGACLAVTNKTFFDKSFWNFLKEVEATSMAGVPYHFEILRKLRFNKMDLPSLRTLTQAGGRMDPELTREFAAHCDSHGIRFIAMYGQTEASPRMSFVPYEQALNKAGSIGLPILGGSFELMGEGETVIGEPYTTGELIYRGPNVYMGYSKCRADLSLEDKNNGVLKTGDLAQRDIDGYYYIIGRKNRFIKLFGNRINLQEIEEYLATKGWVAACLGKDDALQVFVELGTLEQLQNIKKSLVDWLQVGLQGLRVFSVAALPRNEHGKILFVKLDSAKALLNV